MTAFSIALSCGLALPRFNHKKYSTFPEGPGSGLATTPAVPRPNSNALFAILLTASIRWEFSTTTPPSPSASLPTSNCGLTISKASPSGLRTDSSAGSTVASEIKDRSATIRSTWVPKSSGVKYLILVRSITVVRSSVEIFQANCP